MDESTDIENKQAENKTTNSMEQFHTKIEEMKKQDFPNPVTTENKQAENETFNSMVQLITKIEEMKKLDFPNPVTDTENKQAENETSNSMVQLITKIEEMKKQDFPNPVTDTENKQAENETFNSMVQLITKIEEMKKLDFPNPVTDTENKQAENETSNSMVQLITKIEEMKKQDFPNPVTDTENKQAENETFNSMVQLITKIEEMKKLDFPNPVTDTENKQAENETSNSMVQLITKIEEMKKQDFPNPVTDTENKQAENETSNSMVQLITKIEEMKKQDFPNPVTVTENQQSEYEMSNPMVQSDTKSEKQKLELEYVPNPKNIIEDRETENEISGTKIIEKKQHDIPPEIENDSLKMQGCENIPAIAALLLQNSICKKQKFRQNTEFYNINNSDKNENETSLETYLQAPANGIPETMIRSPLPDSELESSNSYQEKILSNSKDSSMLSTTDTQDEIDNGDPLDINDIDDVAEIAARIESAKQELLLTDEDSLESASDSDHETEENSSLVSGSECDEVSQDSIQEKNLENLVQDTQASQDSIQEKHLENPVQDIHEGSQDSIQEKHLENPVQETQEASQDSIKIKHLENPVPDTNKPTDNINEKSKLLETEIKKENFKKEDNNDLITKNENKTGRNKRNDNNEKPVLRRSSRTVKRRKYSYDEHIDDEDSEIDESDSEDPRKRKSRPIMINDTKSLVEIAARQAARSTAYDRREPQLVLIGSKPKQVARAPAPKYTNTGLNPRLYQTIVSRGTTVTALPCKPAPTMISRAVSCKPVPTMNSRAVTCKPASSTVSQAVQTLSNPTSEVLPSLTDDMFVVEAPSFIVPYVYEKPSVKPFKEFVTKLGKDVAEEKAKAEKELLKKKMEEKFKRQKERQDGMGQGKELRDSEDEARPESNGKKGKIGIKGKSKQEHEDESSWDDCDSSDSEDFKITDGTTNAVEGKDDIIDASKGPGIPSDSTSYFDGPLGKFFTNIGIGLVEEYVQRDLIKTQQRKLQREKKAGHSTKQHELQNSINQLKKSYEISKLNNKSLTSVQMKCEHCTFKTESEIVLAQHMETPHMKNNMYKCNFCEFEIRSPHDILFHMEAEHNVRGRLERAPSYHQCVNCPFEDNGKGKLARHAIACAKKFKSAHNMSPPVDWESPAKIPKIAKGRQTMLGAPMPLSSPFGRAPVSTLLPSTSTSNSVRPRARAPGPHMSRPAGVRPVVAGGSIIRGSSIQHQNALAAAAMAQRNHPSISITPMPAAPARPALAAAPGRPRLAALPPHEPESPNFVICEICDGYIKDLAQLRNHMQWIHRIKIHPKMIYNRPPLNCQKCHFRFFTDQGLERHLLGSHGLVTTAMQDAANNNRDSGRCPACGKVFQWRLLNHMSRDHGLSLKPAHLSYKCTVCAATFELYKLFEQHVYAAHNVVAQAVMDRTQPRTTINNVPQRVNIIPETTITAHRGRSSKHK